MFANEEYRERAVKRLAQSKFREMSDVERACRAAGIRWACEVAEASELERLERFVSAAGNYWADLLAGPANHKRPSERLFEIIDPLFAGDAVAILAFEDRAFGGVIPTANHVVAFVAGALDCWSVVKAAVVVVAP